MTHDRTLRRRQESSRDALDRARQDTPGGGSGIYLGQVYSGGDIPTTVPRIFLTHPINLSATEAENQVPTVTVDSSTSIPVLVLGPKVPVAGHNLMARMAGGYWVASSGKATGCSPGITVTFSIKGCHNLALPGTSITFNGSTLVTNASGVVVFDNPGTGTYPIVTAPPEPARWAATTTTSISITGCANRSLTITLTPASGYTCLAFCTGCVYPISRTLYLSDPVMGTVTLSTGVAGSTWQAYGTVTGPVWQDASGGKCTGANSTTGIPIEIAFQPCSSMMGQIVYSWRECDNDLTMPSRHDFRPNPVPAGTEGSIAASTSTAGTVAACPPAYYWQGTLTAGSTGIGSALSHMYGSTFNVIVTE